MLNEKYPNGGLKAMPYIDLKYKWLKDQYNVINEMLWAFVFQWNDISKMIKCERQAYEDFCKVYNIYFSYFFIIYQVSFLFYNYFFAYFMAKKS